MTLMTIPTLLRPSLRRLLGVLALAAVACAAQPVAAQALTADKPPKETDRKGGGNQDDRHRSEDDPTRAELKKRFEARFDQMNELKDRGLIGETYNGLLEALDQRLLSKVERQLLEDENADRKALYDLIAERVDEGEKKVPPRVVAERNGRRNFEKADPRHYLKIDESRWIPKRDEDRADRIARLKKEGVVGETFEGYLEAIRGKGDEDVQRLIEQENRDRRAMYDQIAGKVDKASADQVARDAAKDMYEHLPAGHAYKSKDGAWERRPERQR